MLELIEPHYQNIVFNKGENIYAIEALCRFRNHDRLSQGQIRQWEKTGYVVKIDTWMLKRIRQNIAQLATRKDLRLAVNVSVRTIELAADEYLAELLVLRPHVHRLIVEITESYRPDDWRTVTDFARKLGALGIYIALDDCTPDHIFWDKDFVRIVAPQFLKIDGKALDGFFINKKRDQLLGLLELGEQVRASVVGEHIDSWRKRDWVAELGICYQQGWLFNRPAPFPKRN